MDDQHIFLPPTLVGGKKMCWDVHAKVMEFIPWPLHERLNSMTFWISENHVSTLWQI